MVLTCPTGNDSLGVCSVLEESGTGLGIFLEAIRNPVVKIVIVLGIIGGVLALIVGIVYMIKHAVTKHQ